MDNKIAGSYEFEQTKEGELAFLASIAEMLKHFDITVSEKETYADVKAAAQAKASNMGIDLIVGI
jgi:hypothetical protein